jgi:O-methyltransferase
MTTIYQKISEPIRFKVHEFLRSFGLDVARFPPVDFRADEKEIFHAVRPLTMTSPERVYVLIQAVRYVTKAAIPGAIVECGVWKGGSMAAAARTLLQMKDVSRDLYLFDTFEGMTPPGAEDVDFLGKHASEVWADWVGPNHALNNAPLEQVRNVLYATGYPKEKIHFIEGRVEDTIPASAPESIALLRLDTDWYESTRHELIHLFPRLIRAGVLIIDDYGHWQGSRKACDEYFEQNRVPILLNRIDAGGRVAVRL